MEEWNVSQRTRLTAAENTLPFSAGVWQQGFESQSRYIRLRFIRKTHCQKDFMLWRGAARPAVSVVLISMYSANSAYSSSVKRVLITRRRGVLYLFMAVNLLSWVDFFKRRKPQKTGLGWQPQQDSRRTK